MILIDSVLILPISTCSMSAQVGVCLKKGGFLYHILQ